MAVAAMHGRRRDILKDIHELQGPEDSKEDDITKHRMFSAMLDTILGALEPFPEAKQALMKRLALRSLPPGTGGDSK